MKTRNYLLLFFFAFSSFATALEIIEEVVPQSGRFTNCKPLYQPGSCSSFIHLCDDAYFGVPVIVKYMRPEKKIYLDNEIKIFNMIKKFKHTVRMVDVVNEGEKTFLIMEYANGGNLCEAIRKAYDMKKELRVKEIFMLVMKAIYELHNHRIAHRDIKPDNFFLHHSDIGTYIKIGDFGYSAYVPKGMATSKTFGTLSFMAPEAYDIEQVREVYPKATYDAFKADIYSAGLVLFSLITKGYMFKEPHIKNARFALLKTRGVRGYLKHYKIEHMFDEPTIDLLENMLQIDPQKRPNALTVLMHPWFKREN